MRYIVLSVFFMFIAVGCDDHVEKVDVSSSWNSIMTKLEKSETALTTINPMNRGVVVKTANQIEKYASELYLNHINELDTVSLEYVLECLAKSAEIQSNYNAAIDFFNEAQTLNPSSEKAPAYLHNVARIHDHVLGNKELAKSSYERLINLYPDHPLSKNATIYLENIFDKSEEDLLKMINENNS